MLTERQKKFVRAYRGDGLAAARAAGYAGSDATVKVRASKLLRHPAVAEALAAAAGKARTELAARGRGKKILTLTEMLELCATIARGKKRAPRDRLKAVETAARLEGLLGPVRGAGGAGGAVVAGDAPVASATATATVVMLVDNGRGPA